MYVKTINVGSKTIDKLLSGEIQFKAGQWVKLDWCSEPSRWVGITPAGSVWAVHHPVTAEKLSGLTTTLRKRHERKRQRDQDPIRKAILNMWSNDGTKEKS
jgi:hypothetical protein